MADTTDIKKYIFMENVLNKINQKYVSLADAEKKRNAAILKALIESIESKMKEADTLFKSMFERIFHGGSYYDGLKVSKPEEYDLDLVLNLPLVIEPVVEVSNKHGFVYVKIEEYLKMEGRTEASRYPIGKRANVSQNRPQRNRNRPLPEHVLRKIEKKRFFRKLSRIMDDKYVSTEKVLRWVEGILTNAFKKFPQDNSKRTHFDVDNGKTRLYLTYTKQFPAFTLHVKGPNGITMDIDLVPCLQFTEKQWPKGKYKKNPVQSKNKFLVVPKKPHDSKTLPTYHRYWRLSFQEQERVLITGEQYKNAKPCLRLLKFLKDKYNHKIASYFIKTVFLWELDKKDVQFWQQPLSVVFMKMLKVYEEHLRKKDIPYFWNPQFNLIDYLNEKTTTNIANTMKRMIETIEKNIVEDPLCVAKYFVTVREVEDLRSEVNLGKKFQRMRL